MKTPTLLLILFSVALALAQPAKKSVAVYMSGKEPAAVKGAHKVLGTELAKALTKSGEYTAVDRTEEGRKVIAGEQIIQRSGAIDPKQIKKLGKQFGVDILCIAEITEVMKSHYLEARLVDVETAEVLAVASQMGNMSDGLDIVRTAQAVVQELMTGEEQSSVPSGGGSVQEKTAPSPVSGNVLTDTRDGKKYKTVKIGSQTWMAENLNYAANGSKCYDNNSGNCAKYGHLYDWNTARSACPSGWHLPSYDEWDMLSNAVGGEKIAGKKLKAKSGWKDNGNGTDDYGFSALPGGDGDSDGSFSRVGYYGCWWSASKGHSDRASRLNMNWSGDHAYWLNSLKSDLFSVRCVQD